MGRFLGKALHSRPSHKLWINSSIRIKNSTKRYKVLERINICEGRVAESKAGHDRRVADFDADLRATRAQAPKQQSIILAFISLMLILELVILPPWLPMQRLSGGFPTATRIGYVLSSDNQQVFLLNEITRDVVSISTDQTVTHEYCRIQRSWLTRPVLSIIFHEPSGTDCSLERTVGGSS
jgi:hypothetical protein